MTANNSSIRSGYSEIKDGFTHICQAGYGYGAASARKAQAYAGRKFTPVYQSVVPYVQKTMAVATPVVQKIKTSVRPLAEKVYNRGCDELQEMARGAVAAYHMSRGAVGVVVAKVDRVCDEKLSPTKADVAKKAVRVLPSAAVTVGMLALSYPVKAGALLLGACAHFMGKENTGNGIGLGCSTAGAVHLATGLATGNIGVLIWGAFESAMGARLLGGNGMIGQAHEEKTPSAAVAVPQ